MQPDYEETEAVSTAQEIVVPLHAEELAVTKRQKAGDTIRVETKTQMRDQEVCEELARDEVRIERVPVGRYVDAMPEVRTEGEVTIVPVVEEVLVVERKLRLREEIHIHRMHMTHVHTETVPLREQQVIVTRIPGGPDIVSDRHPLNTEGK